ncbi:MAG TPA: T9SS type A sorting domain-containing protein, partial [Lacibacter sp.]|nr:T9SS type A sorting domain-containing protein [Lacibacter sp.]
KEHPGIDTAATELMTTLTYENSSTITVRMGAATTGSASNTNRMYSIWFRDFNYQQPLILPVKLLSFNGNSHNQKVTLNWMVDMNEDADSYEVEKSTNGRDFSKVALVFPTNKQGVESYIYNAAAPAQGKELYRLKLVDKNGTISYSRILAFQAAGAATANTLRIAGNPAGGQLNVSYQTNNRQITLRVLNMNGGTLLQQTVATMTGTNLIGVDISSIAGTGLYILEVVDGPVRTSTRFVK